MVYPTLWLPNEGHHVTGLGWLLDRAATLEGHGLVGPQKHLIWLSFVVSGLLFVSPPPPHTHWGFSNGAWAGR